MSKTKATSHTQNPVDIERARRLRVLRECLDDNTNVHNAALVEFADLLILTEQYEQRDDRPMGVLR